MKLMHLNKLSLIRKLKVGSKYIFIILLLNIVTTNLIYSQSLDTTLYQEWEEITGDNIYNAYTLKGIKSIGYLIENSDTIPPMDHETLARFIYVCTNNYLKFIDKEDKWNVLYKHEGTKIASLLIKKISNINQCQPRWADYNLLFSYPEKAQYCLLLIEQGIDIYYITEETNETVIDVLVTDLLQTRGNYVENEVKLEQFNLSEDHIAIFSAISYFLNKGVSFKYEGRQISNDKLSIKEKRTLLEKIIYKKALTLNYVDLIFFMNIYEIPW
jgi:hypothetical protein